MFFNITLKSKINTFFLALFSKNPVKELISWYNIVNKKQCPICNEKMHKNALNTYNCGKCFTEFANKYLGENI